MDNFIKLLSLLLSEIKDPATLLKRVGTVFLTLFVYFMLTNSAQIGSYIKMFSASSVVADLQAQRVLKFPDVAREKAMILYSQTKADAVFVIKYKPDAINDYQSIVAWESNTPLDRLDLGDKAVDKTSDLYRRQLDGFNYLLMSGASPKQLENRYLGEDIPSLKNIQLKFVYTCPYFNLNNLYTGYIAIGWKESPVQAGDIEKFSDYLARLCDPQRRGLGRSI